MNSSAGGSDAFTAGLAALDARRWPEAVACLEEATAADPRPEVLEALGTAYFWTDRPETIDVRERAYRAHRAVRDPYGAARVATALAWDHLTFRGEESVARGWLQLAGRALDGQPASAEHGHLALWEADFALTAADLVTAAAQAARALELGRRLEDADIELLASAQLGLVRLLQGEVDAGMQMLEATAVAAIAGEIEDPAYAGYACCYLITACHEVRDVGRATEWCAKLDELCSRAGFHALLQVCRTEYAGVLVEVGEWQRAEHEMLAAVDVLAAKRPPLAAGPTVRLAELRRRQGRTTEAVELFSQAPGHDLAMLGLGLIALDAGDTEGARNAAERYLRQHLPGDRIGRFRGLDLLVHALAAAGEPARAEEPLRELHETVAGLRSGTMVAAVHHADAAVRLAAGDAAAARVAAEDAVAHYERAGSSFGRIRTLVLLSRVLEQLGDPAGARRAAAASAAGLAALGAVDTVAAVNQRILTPREVDVLRLVAEGLSNSQVAQRLHVSEHTVHRHMANILAKLDVSTRAAAVGRAAELGVL